METKYYTINIHNQNKSRMERQRRKILRRRIKCACGIIGFLSFFYLIGIVGGFEQDMLTIKEFIIHGIVAIGLLVASIEINERI